MPEDQQTTGTGVLSAGRRPASWLWLLVSVTVIALDQFTKQLIVRGFELYDRVPVAPFIDLIRLHNSGAAFSLLAGAGGWQNWFFSGMAVVISVVLVVWLRRVPREQIVVPLGLMLVLGGAIGNLIDRVAYGHVVDFVLLYYGSWSWPAFNVADSAISGGVVLLLLDGLVLERRRLRPAAAPTD